jgi:hypothetical protein
MKPPNKAVKFFLAVILSALLSLPLLISGCSHPFPYQGSINGNWTGQLTIIGRAVPIGGTLSIKIDAKGVASGTIASTSGGASTATVKAQVDSDGNLNGTVSLTLGGTTFLSTWQGKITGSGNSLALQGTWTSDHGSGTFSGTGTSSK